MRRRLASTGSFVRGDFEAGAAETGEGAEAIHLWSAHKHQGVHGWFLEEAT